MPPISVGCLGSVGSWATTNMADELETITLEDAAAWDAWLAENHQRQEGVWLKIAKKRTGVASVTDDEAVDVGLCWGWISGHRKALDETYFLQRYTPRRPRATGRR